MGDALQDIDRKIAQLRQVSGLARDVAPDIARVVELELRANIARGVAPDGTPWPLTEDGRVPLRNAAQAVSVRASGDQIVVTLGGVESRHHLGAVRGGIARPLIPSTLPPALAEKVDAVIMRAFAQAMGAR